MQLFHTESSDVEIKVFIFTAFLVYLDNILILPVCILSADLSINLHT